MKFERNDVLSFSVEDRDLKELKKARIELAKKDTEEFRISDHLFFDIDEYVIVVYKVTHTHPKHT